jgi:hypothetical protein
LVEGRRQVEWQPPIDPKQIVSSEELLMSQVVSQEAIIRLLVEKGIFSSEEFIEMVKVVDRGMKRKKKVAV